MKLTTTGYGIKALFVLLFLGLQYGLLEAKAIKKSKHVHKSGSKKNNAPKGSFCVNHSYCVKYSDLDCASEWVQLNCPRMCRLCEYEGADFMKLPAVLYYKKGDKKHGISKKGNKKDAVTGMKHKKHKSKHASKVVDKRDNIDGGRRDVVFLSRPADYSPTKSSNADQPPPTTSYSLFDYKGNYRNWLFLYPEQHPVNMHYVDQGKAADPNQQNGAQQQATGTQDSTAAATAPAVGVPDAATPEAQGASQATAAFAAAQPAAPAVAAPAVAAAANPAVPQVGQAAAAAVQQPAAPVAAQQAVAAQPEAAANETIQLINQTVSLATNNTFEPAVANVSQTNQTIMVGAFAGANNTSNQTVAPGTVDLTSTGQSFSQDVTVDPQAGGLDQPEQSDYSWTCCKKQPRPEGCKKCPDLAKAPPLPYVFNVYCDDLYKDCAYGYSNCNDTWWQINCPKRCNLCKAKDQQNATATQTTEIYPNEVKSLTETSELESNLVAPAPGRKPLVAKYTLRVKPKLLNGVPQTQEIRIMPPNKAGTAGYVKPLMVLKQNITKPMIENIEIDVPPKGAKFSSKPSVEVIEGDHTEMLTVSKGQAIVEDPAVQKSKTKSEEIKETKPEQDSAAQPATDQTATDQTESSSATTQAAPQDTASYHSDTQTQSPWDTQAAQTAATATQADATATQTDATAAQTTAPATEAAAATTDQSAAAPVAQPDASATQTAAYTNTETCTDDGRCAPYTADRCADPWLMANCKSMCKLC
ncbi:uncharacterized protein LOC144656666 [Oculina patagonica]